MSAERDLQQPDRLFSPPIIRPGWVYRIEVVADAVAVRWTFYKEAAQCSADGQGRTTE